MFFACRTAAKSRLCLQPCFACTVQSCSAVSHKRYSCLSRGKPTHRKMCWLSSYTWSHRRSYSALRSQHCRKSEYLKPRIQITTFDSSCTLTSAELNQVYATRNNDLKEGKCMLRELLQTSVALEMSHRKRLEAALADCWKLFPGIRLIPLQHSSQCSVALMILQLSVLGPVTAAFHSLQRFSSTGYSSSPQQHVHLSATCTAGKLICQPL